MNRIFKQKGKYQKKLAKSTVMLVTVLCLLVVFTGAAFATKLFGLKDTLVDTKDPGIKSEISLAGFSGSKEFMAAAEWKAFEESYDPDGSILAQLGSDDPQIDEKYMHYSVYTQEMADKLDEITTKYGLKLHTSFVLGDLNTLTAKLIINDDTEFSDNPRNTALDGYMYDDGTFSYDGIFDASVGRLSVDYQFRCTVKGIFDSVSLNIGDIADYREQVIVTDSGTELVAALSEYKSVLLAQFDACFVTINVLGGTDMGITFEDLKDLANTFDFSVIENRKDDAQQTVNTNPESEQSYIEVSREGIVEKISVETVPILNGNATIAMDPEYFSHNVRKGVDTFIYDAWTGKQEVYYSVSRIPECSPSQICDRILELHGENYANSHVFAVKIGSYNGTTVQFDGEAACPLQFFIIPTDQDCIVIEAQFDFEMYEGLYQIMLALFDTLQIR
ncbi:MAG: hypothetical protein IIX23_04790 [Oscillospiraceae bacterium]|nr:hypothetical protein [Oscillospiraceae bacterium]